MAYIYFWVRLTFNVYRTTLQKYFPKQSQKVAWICKFTQNLPKHTTYNIWGTIFFKNFLCLIFCRIWIKHWPAKYLSNKRLYLKYLWNPNKNIWICSVFTAQFEFDTSITKENWSLPFALKTDTAAPHCKCEKHVEKHF